MHVKDLQVFCSIIAGAQIIFLDQPLNIYEGSDHLRDLEELVIQRKLK